MHSPLRSEALVQTETHAPSEPVSRGRLSSALLVDDETEILSFLHKGLKARFDMIERVQDTRSADALMARSHFDLIIVDVRLPDQSGVQWVTQLREQDCTTPVIFMTAHADLQTAIAAVRAGVSDIITKPFRLEQMQTAVDRCLERKRIQAENYVLHRQVEQYYDNEGIIGNCDAVKSLCTVVKRIAPMPSTVLIEGESGTGKELAARAIHQFSGRGGSFVPMNCGAMNAELLESELFGHAKGAFTGAIKAREGLFSYADGGTLFLDEIGEMPLAMQTRLLRVLEERSVRPVGGNREIPVDVRIVTATNRNLREEVDQGNFREDLFYRLNVLSIRIPSLRERLEDLPDLVRHFASNLSQELGIEAPDIGEDEIARLRRYDWPGNIRELRNVIERSLLLNCPPSQCLASVDMAAAGKAPPDTDDEDLSLEAVERRHILRVLGMHDGNKSAAARVLGVSRKTLERKCQAWEASGLMVAPAA
jgi:DNA-binding NtrC family response regulator